MASSGPSRCLTDCLALWATDRERKYRMVLTQSAHDRYWLKNYFLIAVGYHHHRSRVVPPHVALPRSNPRLATRKAARWLQNGFRMVCAGLLGTRDDDVWLKFASVRCPETPKTGSP
jgi:hypothetical protein